MPCSEYTAENHVSPLLGGSGGHQAAFSKSQSPNGRFTNVQLVYGVYGNFAAERPHGANRNRDEGILFQLKPNITSFVEFYLAKEMTIFLKRVQTWLLSNCAGE